MTRRWLLRALLRFATALVLIAATVYLARAFASRSLLPLKPEHRVRFAEEFRAKQEEDTDWAAYLELEDRITAEAAKAIPVRQRGPDILDRYATGSLSNPDTYPVNWNRSFVLHAETPRGVAVLLHGLSDSPYSVRATAQIMRDNGVTAYAPRMPGHGFAVGDLRRAKWDDWIAVVRIAMRAADRERRAGQPIILVGYSNGGLLAIRYALDCNEKTDMPCPDTVLLMSPAIEVTPFAWFGRWHRAVSWISYFEKFQWETVLPEIDPYKFSSFPKNPGREIDLAARALSADLVAGSASLPPILAFQSAVDDTVSTRAVIDFVRHLPANGSELVLYDVNRVDRTATLMIHPPPDLLQSVEDALPLSCRVTVITNESEYSAAVRAYHYDGSSTTPVSHGLGLAWPGTIFSLSHIALPFEPGDPVYGPTPAAGVINLGGTVARGERKVLSLTPNYFARLRYNPFFPYQKERIIRWLDRWLEPQDSPSP